MQNTPIPLELQTTNLREVWSFTGNYQEALRRLVSSSSSTVTLDIWTNSLLNEKCCIKWTFPKRYPLCPWFSSLMPNSKVTKKLGKVIKLFLFHLQFTDSDLETTLFINFQFSKTILMLCFQHLFMYFTSVICVKSWKFVSFDI